MAIGCSKSADPAQLTLSLPSTARHPQSPGAGTSSASADGKKAPSQADSGKPPQKEPPSLPLPIPAKVIPQLHEMAQRLIAAGHHQQCIRAYR